MKLRFNTCDCRLLWSRYAQSRRPALLLVNARSPGDLIAVASVELPGVDLEVNEIAIKDFGPSAGALEALHAAWVISKPVRFVEVGKRAIPICKLLVDAKNRVH
ncbi:hypothetical protein Thiowin_02537 [Thiorhodovibrio winogradskyi]|uniref:Uncharacterized protein n=1 Tax=Thiorhodovibrio winogradskyi TaxID=77007 RepID=A0ABZ0SBU5_9GAMM|nr:hypothetical protein [Thiorhodovibrio winogradskyi]